MNGALNHARIMHKRRHWLSQEVIKPRYAEAKIPSRWSLAIYAETQMSFTANLPVDLQMDMAVSISHRHQVICLVSSQQVITEVNGTHNHVPAIPHSITLSQGQLAIRQIHMFL
jgi:hypothetical protein